MDGNYLLHHGTKGQKWGVRRYQNEDGTLTAAGKIRYAYNAVTSGIANTYDAGKRVGGDILRAGRKVHDDVKSAKAEYSRTEKKGRDAAAKDARHLSDDEISSRLDRLRKEKQLRDVTEEVEHPIRKEVRDVGKTAGKAALTGLAMFTVYELGKHSPEIIRYGESRVYYMKDSKVKDMLASKTYKNKRFENARKSLAKDSENFGKMLTNANPFKKK